MKQVMNPCLYGKSWSKVLCFAVLFASFTAPQFLLSQNDVFVTRPAYSSVAKFGSNGSGLNLSHISPAGGVSGVTVDATNGKIYFTLYSSGKIGVSNLDGSGLNSSLISGLQNPTGITVDPANGKIYWAEEGSKTIKRANTDGTGTTILLNVVYGTPYDVAISPGTNQLFWCARLYNYIGVATLNGGSPNPNFINCGTTTHGILGLGIDRSDGKLYWANYSADAIGRANLDGTGVTNSHIPGCIGPVDVVADPAAGKLYWTNSRNFGVGTGNTDGTGINQNLVNGIERIWAIDMVPTLCPDPDGDGLCSNVDNCPNVANVNQANFDGDGLGDACDPDDDNDGSLDANDSNDNNLNICSDTDNDGCDDCSSGTYNPANDGPDGDGDGLCDNNDTDDDNDGVSDANDPVDNNNFICGDSDNDGCDDCAVAGTFAPNNDGPDNDGDGTCNTNDPDDDGDGSPDTSDSNDNNPNVCSDTDSDGCDDCTLGTYNPANDGPDNDSDGICNTNDPDDDNDGSSDANDSDDNNPNVCSDTDNDGCDDCTSGTYDPANDGSDNDGDGFCNTNDPDDDNDMVSDPSDPDDNNPFICGDSDLDGCDDCSVSGFSDPNNDGPDDDGDGLCNTNDNDDDNDGVNDAPDPVDDDPFICGDSDMDGCDDCEVAGTFAPANDGPDNDGDGLCNTNDPDDDNDGVDDATDPDDNNEFICGDSDNDGCDDCSVSGTFDIANDGPDNDGDGFCNTNDPDDDNDGVSDGSDPDDNNEFICGDSDMDGCDDCSVTGYFDTANDGADFDGDGLCDTGDLDDDNDTVNDATDPDDNNEFICGDTDMDGCDDCSISGIPDLSNDGPDNDGDGICNTNDPDDDGDTVNDPADPDDNNEFICGDTDMDGCDDCSISGYPNLSNDGADYDNDGLCDLGDPDDDNDMVLDGNDPDDANSFVCGDSDNDGCDDCAVTGTINVANDGPDNDSDGLCNTGDPDDDNDGSLDVDDCNDFNATIYPGATEVCDGIDQDCDNLIDDGVLLTYYQDSDGDMFGNPNNTTQGCTAPMGYVANNTDCNDANAAVNPGATEVCNGIDDDCDATTDEGFPNFDGDSMADCVDPDDDNDGSLDPADCNDFNATIYPGAPELCNGIDDDCDGIVDDNLAVCCISASLPACKTVFINFPPRATVTLSPTVSGNGGSLTYVWSSGQTTPSITVSPVVTTIYTVTVTGTFNGNTCTATASTNVQSFNAQQKSDGSFCNGNNQIVICSSNGNEQCVGIPSLCSHIGSRVGNCSIVACEPFVITNSNCINGNHPSTSNFEQPDGETEAAKASLDLFPNPANQLLTIQLKLAPNSKTRVMIINSFGQAVWSASPADDVEMLQVDLSNGKFLTGIYSVVVMTKGEVLEKRLVVSKQ